MDGGTVALGGCLGRECHVSSGEMLGRVGNFQTSRCRVFVGSGVPILNP